MKANTIAIRDNLLAALRAADEALTTDQVCEAAGPVLEQKPCRATRGHYEHNRYIKVLACDGHVDTLLVDLVIGQRGYRQLRALEARGLVRRFRIEGWKPAYWAAVRVPELVDVDELEQLLSGHPGHHE